MRLLPVIGLLLLHLTASGQVVDAALDKLASKFHQADFVWVLKKAEALMDDDKAKKDPEPFMWAAMCYFELHRSEDPKLSDTYRNGLREALKLAAKSASKDKDGTFIAKQTEFLNELKKEGIAIAQAHAAEQDYRKASHVYKQVMSFNPEDDNVRFAKAVIDLRMNNVAEAEKLIAQSLPRIEASYRDLSFKPDPVSSPLLRDAVIYYIDHLAMNNLRDSARYAAFVGRIIFPLDEDIKFKAESLK